jgi:hypothetical protein
MVEAAKEKLPWRALKGISSLSGLLASLAITH